MSLIGRSTCVSASALNLDAQPAHVERDVSLISRPVRGIGIFLLNSITSNQSLWLLVKWALLYSSSFYGVVVVGVGAGVVVFGNGKMN